MGTDASVGRAEYAMIGLGALAYACYTFSWFVLPATLSPMIAEVGLTTTQAGLLVGAIPAVYVPLGLASGLLIDRLGSRSAIGIALVVFGVVQLARGVATDFWTLLLPTLLMGVAGTAITFGLPKLVSDLFPPSQTGSMSSVYQIGASAGPAVAFGLAMPVLSPVLGGWRPIFLANGVIVLGFALVWWVTSTAYVRRRDWGATGGLQDDDPDPAFTLASARRDLRQVFGSRNMRLLILVGLMYLFVNHGLRGWLAVILESRGYSPAISGVATSLFVVAGIA
ncbi:MAG: MFS transporter, partial [Halobacteriales archaeon]|nr:MFS transporter [Halobacteriales archaeon]